MPPLRRSIVVVRARIDRSRRPIDARFAPRRAALSLSRVVDWMFRAKVTHTDARVRFVVRVVACVPIATFAYKMSIDRAKDEERRMRRGT